MGLTNVIIDFQEEIIQKIGFQWQNIRICELGAMYMRTVDIPAKEYYIKEKKVLEHISIDWNGMYDSLPIDLCFPVPEELLNRFHLITDFGTIEHVDNQYQVFKNTHDICTKNGIMIHILPTLNYWKFHCRYFYTKEFFLKLAELCKYKTLDLKEGNCCDPPIFKRDLIYVAFLKLNNNKFTSEKEFNKLNIFDIKEPDNTNKLRTENIVYILWKLTEHQFFLKGFRKILKNIYKIYINVKKGIK